jgi:hypothetical protein
MLTAWDGPTTGATATVVAAAGEDASVDFRGSTSRNE